MVKVTNIIEQTLIDANRLQRAYDTVKQDLLDARNESGYWTGRLASSALSTATAVSALAIYRQKSGGDLSDEVNLKITLGLDYLASQQNRDGGWGDTDKSYSNISTSTLAVAAFNLAGCSHEFDQILLRASRYLDEHGGAEKIKARYGKDKTFAVPILANAALAGMVDWKEVGVLPFEASIVPQRFYNLMQLPVVSYAIPALVAIGQAKFINDPPRNPVTRLIRKLSVKRSLAVLEQMQPESGGYLEAIPLTSFVVMSLAATDRHNHPVVLNGVRFILESFRDDGSWPIDTNLATWNTTLAINALAGSGEDISQLDCWNWLLQCQHKEQHPFTGAKPGGFGWSDLSGAVPDSDDTPGAILSLRQIAKSNSINASLRASVEEAIKEAERWLVKLQNRDGGWPTFCRGWGKLPFDRSGSDLTAHVLRAFKDSKNVPSTVVEQGFLFLERTQRENGCWIPLWFGNQDVNNEENPVYGTAKVLMAYRDWKRFDTKAAQRGLNWLIANQNVDGGWGGGPSVAEGVNSSQYSLKQKGTCSSLEETALAIEAIAGFAEHEKSGVLSEVINQGTHFLIDSVEQRQHLEAWPIGFYFAKLWYYEQNYPLVFTLAALGQVAKQYNLKTVSNENLSLAGVKK